MSTSADPATISDVASVTTTYYCYASAAALLIYYYLTTLDAEFKHYSKRKFTLATLLYLTNRYIPLVYNVYASPAEAGIEFGLEQLQYFPWAIFSALRTYALQRKLYWAAVVFILSLAPVIANGRFVFEFVYECSVVHKSLIAPVLARVPVIIADILVISVTWKTQYKTYGLRKDLPTPIRLTTVLLRDGTIYFVVLTILDILLLVFEYLHQYSRHSLIP
ncbi:hypothetical protein ONZ51_g5917 [Trametes cubensis]|uniref:DUF6533 domain-containing protein n=1 Tax=Trametes cubensis TaxID=1111947 RepID=A0AAD7XAI0_9APHY|nr:hypothetical protein ONZ51_g5917 [Trametes cubensis]